MIIHIKGLHTTWKQVYILLLSSLILLPGNTLNASIADNNKDYKTSSIQSNLINIRNSNGKLYAYIVLLFNENPHFVNLIQEDSIPLKAMQSKNFHIINYKHYLVSLKNPTLQRYAKKIFDIYVNPRHYQRKSLSQIETTLEKRHIILRFSKTKIMGEIKIVLDYCIYGKRTLINIKHPLFNINEKIYNIQPLIYYDEFTTSNSTFYFDMIYINPEEVQNDYLIAKKILEGKNANSMFFVGARVSDDIKYCLKKAFSNQKDIKTEIWKMFEIHELTHKILNNHYNFYDQVTGEELSLSSTIYANPYLGLAVLYSYLDYNTTNPHRIGALNYIRFISRQTGNTKIADTPSLLRNLPEQEILRLTKQHFQSIKKIIKQ